MSTTQSPTQASHLAAEHGPHTEHPDYWMSKPEYNFEHFRAKHLLFDIQGTLADRGIPPGTEAPDFTLVRAGGGMVTLSDLRGKPVVLHFGSPT